MYDGSIRIDTKIEDNNVTRELRKLQRELSAMQHEMELANLKAMLPFKKQMIETEKEMFQLAKTMGNYSGTTQEFMGEVNALGKAFKKTQDEMINADRSIAQSMIQTAGQMANMSTQASKVRENYERMGNPMYTVNKLGLGIADTMNKIANNGNEANLALRMLGPNASMKQLYDMQNLITQGVMRFEMVSLTAGATAVKFYGSLHKAAMEANEGYKQSFEGMITALRQAIDPLITVFADVMTYVYNGVTAIADWVSAFNESHPVIAKVVAAVVLLVPALMLLLSPLAVGVGLIAGMQAAFASVWALIGPIVTGLGAMSGTVWLVAGAIVALTAGIIYLWNNHEGFKETVISTWNAIKSAVVSVIDFITPYLQQAYEVMVAYAQEKLAQIRQFWEENGQQILQAVQNVWSFITDLITSNMNTISTIIDVAMKVVLAVVEYVWNAIKSIIDGAISFITGIIEVFTGLLTGDFTLMWEGIKSIFSGAIDMIVGWMSLTFVGGIRTLLTNLSKTAINLIKTKWTTIVNTFKTFGTNAINSAKSMVDSVVNFFKNLLSQAQSIFGTLRTFGASVWEALKTVVVNAASTIYNTGRQKFIDLFNSVKTTLSNLKTTVSGVAQSIVNFFKNINLYNIGKSIVQGLINGIKNMKSLVFSAISSLIPSGLKTAASGLMSSLGLKGYAKGGIITKPEIAWIGEGGDTEAVIPWNNSQRSKDLWYRTGQALGMFDDGTLANTTKSINAAASKLTGTVSYPTAVTASIGGTNGNSGNVTVTSDTSIADVILDGEKVGRVVAKTVSKVQYNRATLNAAMKGMNL